MSRAARQPLPADDEFEVVQPRYVAMPALLWALSMLAVVIVTVVGTAAEPVSAQAAEQPPGLGQGA
jgi:cytochrome c-type biogenesis protein CcmH/NrfF